MNKVINAAILDEAVQVILDGDYNGPDKDEANNFVKERLDAGMRPDSIRIILRDEMKARMRADGFVVDESAMPADVYRRVQNDFRASVGLFPRW